MLLVRLLRSFICALVKRQGRGAAGGVPGAAGVIAGAAGVGAGGGGGGHKSLKTPKFLHCLRCELSLPQLAYLPKDPLPTINVMMLSQQFLPSAVSIG